MSCPCNWRKSSYSGGAEATNCVEVAALTTCIGIRDSKDPGRGTLTVPHSAFTALLGALKVTPLASAEASPM
ncbi:DUF397 domain-containing protein [Streptomyces sp. NPDC046939]|uniref:DUF397 domain-containing protein n=1 Tax=Streptomyces sp. NPDC046939 TaxID=3155376 RepID=UPI0034097A9D